MLPNTNEIFVDVKSFIRFNKEYPGKCYIKISDIEQSDSKVITMEKSMDKGKQTKLLFYIKIQV